MKKGLKLSCQDWLSCGFCSNYALMKKGLKHSLSVCPFARLSFELRPDEEGIETLLLMHLADFFWFELRPDEEGIETIGQDSVGERCLFELRPDEEGIETDRTLPLRGLPCVRTTP